MKTQLLKFSAVALGLLAALLLCEAVVRLFPSVVDRFDPGFYSEENRFTFDAEVGYVNKKNRRYILPAIVDPQTFKPIVVETNSDGYRDEDFVLKLKDPKMRIAALGDSFTEAYQVDASAMWPRKLQELLGSERFAVFNLGVHNYGLPEYLLTIEHKLNQIKPDLIVVGLFMLNDIYEYAPVDSFERRQQVKSLLNSISLGTTVAQALRRRAATAPSPTGPSPPHRCFPGYVNNADYERNYFHAYQEWTWKVAPDSAEFQKGFAVSIAYLERMVALAKVPVIFMLIPFRDQIDDGWWSTYQCLFQPTGERRFALQEEILRQFHHPYLLDLTPEFHRQSHRPLYLKFDGHWDVEGHELAARLLADYIRRSGIALRP